MATRNHSRRTRLKGRISGNRPRTNLATPKQTEPPEAPEIGYSDDTDARIRAFLASMQCLFDEDEVYEGFHRGRSVIERIARSATGADDPKIRLSLNNCRDVLHFLAQVQPREPIGWWKDPEDAPSHVVGLQLVLFALKASLEAAHVRNHGRAASG
jgi:hypothetical protein